MVKGFKKYIRVNKTLNERITRVKTAIIKEYLHFYNNAIFQMFFFKCTAWLV